jgi:hypothetical protein
MPSKKKAKGKAEAKAAKGDSPTSLRPILQAIGQVTAGIRLLLKDSARKDPARELRLEATLQFLGGISEALKAFCTPLSKEGDVNDSHKPPPEKG